MSDRGHGMALANPLLPELSIVVPCHDEAGNVEPLYREVVAALSGVAEHYELIFVDDGSADATARRVRHLAAADARVRLVELDGNFGEAAALSAGFHAARGAVVVSIDGDGQNDPAAIPALLRAMAEPGVLAVSACRIGRVESVRRVLPSLIANRLIAASSGVPVRDCGCGLKAYARRVVEGVHLPSGIHRFLPPVLGVPAKAFRQVEIRDRPRGSGASHYGLRRVPIVLRDLAALPFIAGDRRRNEFRCALACAALAALAAAVWETSRAAGSVADVAALYFGVAWWGVRRFNRAQREGVYRLREVGP